MCGNNEQLQKNKSLQDTKVNEIMVPENKVQKNAGIPPVINEELEKSNTAHKKEKEPAFSEEKRTMGQFMGAVVLEYDKSLEAKQKENGLIYGKAKGNNIDNMTMIQILEAMERDTNTKHHDFLAMEASFKALVNYSKNLENSKKSGQIVMDYKDVFRYAQVTAQKYQTTHKKWIFGTSYGKERYKISCRIVDIMKGLETYSEDKRNRLEQIGEDKVKYSRVEDIINEKNLTEKEKGKLIEDWLENGAQYKDVLIKILTEKKLFDSDKQTLTRIIADNNRRLMANKAMLSILCDENPQLTLGLSGLKKKLNDHILNKIDSDEKNMRMLFEEVSTFREHINALLDEYRNDNKQLIERVRKRKNTFAQELSIDINNSKFWEDNDINYLLTEAEDEAFRIRLDIYKSRCEDNNALIDQIIEDQGYSALTKDSIKEKVRQYLGTVYLNGGEVAIAQKVNDAIKILKTLAPAEYKAESMIKHLMDVCQVPPSDKDAFAKYISKDETVTGLLNQKTSALRKRADQYVENLNGIKMAENLCYNKKLKLKEETWQKIEELKNNMGKMEKKEFRKKLQKLLDENNAHIDLRKPNITFAAFNKSREKSRVRQDIGFSARIMGDLFLGSKEITSILSKEEIQFFKENIISNICSGGKNEGDLEFLPTGSIKSIAAMLKKNLVANKDFIKALREEEKDNPEIINEMLMKMAMSSENLTIGDLNDMLQSIADRHEYDKRVEEEKGKMHEALKAGGSNDASLSKERYFTFLKQLEHLRKCKAGRYALMAEQLSSENEVYSVMMRGDAKALDKYLDNVVEKRMGAAIDAINSLNIHRAFKQIYIDKKFKDIFTGKLSGNIVIFKYDLRKEQKAYFDENELNEKNTDKNVSEAVNNAVKALALSEAEDAGKIDIVYKCADEVVKACYEDKDKLGILTSKVALQDEIEKAYQRYDDNRDIVEKALKDLGTKKESLFFGYGQEKGSAGNESLLNASAFIRSVKTKMMMTDKNDLTRLLPELLENYEKAYKNSKLKEKSLTDAEIQRGNEIAKKKAGDKTIKDDRDKLIGVYELRKDLKYIYMNKSLVTVEGETATSLSHSNWQKARDYVDKKLSPIYKFDKFLVDLLVEKNVNSIADNEIDVHAEWLYHVSDILANGDENEEKISSDEHKLLVINAYRNINNFANPEEEGQFLTDRNTVKGQWYKDFRENYKELKKLEELKLDFAPLEQERIGISRDLRAILTTGIGKKNSFADKSKEAIKYLTYVNAFMKTADETLSQNDSYKKQKRIVQMEYLLNLRRFYHDRIFEELSDSSKSEFDADSWKEDLEKVAKDDVALRFIGREAVNESVSSKEYNKKNRNFAELIGRDSIEKLIKEKGSHGCLKKYNKLSENEKELFSLGLMLMEKGAIGFDSGSAMVLANSELREKEVKPKLNELAKYMAGQDYDFKIDYTQAYYKLINIGDDYGDVRMAFSSSAFEKAYEFAKAITGKMSGKDEKITRDDLVRMGDGISSIYEAALLGKTRQIDEVDKLRKSQVGVENVKEKLLEFAQLDEKNLKHYENFFKAADTATSASPFNVVGKIVLSKLPTAGIRSEIEKRQKVIKRLQKINDADMRKLIAVLQNRTILDVSAADRKKHIDEDKREEFKLFFSEDDQGKALEKFLKSGACMQALISALSFGINDKRSLKDTRLTKDDFDSNSYNRKSIVDWELLDKAFNFLDELEKDRLTRYAIRNAPNYIEASGNKKAIAAYQENVKNKEASSIKRDDLEQFLRKEAEKDRVTKDNIDAKIALSGYERLSDQQKKLFIKVLGRRDFLDISKKNLYKNIFSSGKERNFANETGRFRLIDEYIDQSIGGNTGVTLSDTAYADAFKSLLSTQVDDTANFKDAKHIGDVLSKEKYYIFQRDTAVDWKLFIRALQFVTRASYELDMREGNDELYRAAGDISRYGHLSMDYSILRQNIHNTGNQFLRFGARKSKDLLTEDVLGEFDIAFGMNLHQLKNDLRTVAGIVAPSFAEKMDELDEVLKPEKSGREKRIKDLPEFLTKDPRTYDFKKMAIDKGKEMLVGKLYTAEPSFTNEINDLVLEAFTSGVKLDKIGALIKKKIDEKPSAGKEKRLDELIGDYKVERQYGDIRDEINAITDKYNEIKNYPEKLKKQVYNKMGGETVKELLDMKIASSVKELIENQYTEATAYVFSKIDEVKGIIVDDLSDKPFVKEIMGAVKEAMEKSKDAKEFLTKLKEKPQELVDMVQDKAKETTTAIIEGAIGKEALQVINEKTQIITNFADSLMSKVSWVTNKISKYKVYIDGFRDIYLSIQNKKLLKDAQDRSVSEEVRKSDEDTLKKADAFENDRQKKVRNNAVSEHKDMQKLSAETSDTIQNMAIADDVIKMSMALGEEIFGKIDAGSASKLVTAAVNAGIEFAMYCIRCVKDWKMMRTYYTDTERGQNLVREIKSGYEKLSGSEQVMEGELMGRDVLDIVCIGSGYENRDELIRDTGMKMATSIAFCASNYNPVKETKVMATTVMIVLGLKDKIGKTDVSTVKDIFDKMKAA